MYIWINTLLICFWRQRCCHQGGKLVWSDGSPADFSVWLEGSDPPPLSWACIAVFATAIFQVKIGEKKGNKSEKLVLVSAFSLLEKFVCLWVRRSLRRTASSLLTHPFHTGQKHLTNLFLIVHHCLLCHFVAKLNTTLRRQAAVLGLVKKKKRRWKISMFAKSKFLLKVDPHTTYYMISNTQTKTCESILINYLHGK